MIRSIQTAVIFCLVLLSATLLISCGGGGSSTSTATGTLELGLTDASTGDYQAIYITIGEVQVKKQNDAGSGWETILTPAQTYNLLELVNGVIATLGVGELEAGRYGQMRLILDGQPDDSENILENPHPYANYLIDSQDNAIELKVPSGFQSGIKIVKGFTIVAAQATELILDFDAARSVVQAGKSGKWLLKPTIKVLETVQNSISGIVNDGSDPIEGALVSAQIFGPGAADVKDEVSVETATLSNEEGAYKLYLPPDIYNIVVSSNGYLPSCQEVEAQYFENYTADFSLTEESGIITISGTVSGLATEEESAVLSIRQSKDCGSGAIMIEVASISVAEGGSYSIILPAGTYDVIAWAEGKTTQVFEDINADTELDIVFNI
jgi:hypothetical protein